MDITAQALTAAKRAAGYQAADTARDGMVLGLGYRLYGPLRT